ncbi:MAG: acyl-CoA dehydrogenase family protein [Acidimicrobiales bacterium]|nr:acyl-CoA dehydrogenase family protein [Acidimicrobiales bacterium]
MSAADLDEFRSRCRAFLEANATGIDVSEVDDPRSDKALAQAKSFQGKLADAGLAGLMYPTQYGGQGLTAEHERIWREEAGKFPPMTRQLSISQGMCLPMLNEYGTDQQRQTYQARLIRADEVWCQMFSEPGAGSDVASLQSRAVKDGDEWVLNGQKVWTTLAHVCDRGIVIARTDPDQPKHRGISMFILDMTAPGVEIRPIHQVDGGMRFNEVFFNDVRIPADHQIGPLNEGWRLATAMLMYERVAIGTGQTGGIAHERADHLIDQARRRGNIGDRMLRQELMRLYTAEVCQSLVASRTRAEVKAGRTPGPGGSLGKLAGANIARRFRALSFAIQGAGGVAWARDDEWTPQAVRNSLATLSSHIAGGTDEIQRNIIGERVLGLPREPSLDKDLPFRELRVGTQA